jgi:pimeloyl-ACP methyl ester carboxylesterase
LIHAGAGHQVRGVIAMAPHVFVEEICIRSIVEAARSFETTAGLPEKLGRYHRDVRKTFYGWADVWRDPEFRGWDITQYLPRIRCPVLALQGHDDEYGTMAQLDAIKQQVGGPCEVLKLADCGHAPFRDQPEKTLSAVTAFIDRLKA